MRLSVLEARSAQARFARSRASPRVKRQSPGRVLTQATNRSYHTFKWAQALAHEPVPPLLELLKFKVA